MSSDNESQDSRGRSRSSTPAAATAEDSRFGRHVHVHHTHHPHHACAANAAAGTQVHRASCQQEDSGSVDQEMHDEQGGEEAETRGRSSKQQAAYLKPTSKTAAATAAAAAAAALDQDQEQHESGKRARPQVVKEHENACRHTGRAAAAAAVVAPAPAAARRDKRGNRLKVQDDDTRGLNSGGQQRPGGLNAGGRAGRSSPHVLQGQQGLCDPLAPLLELEAAAAAAGKRARQVPQLAQGPAAVLATAGRGPQAAAGAGSIAVLSSRAHVMSVGPNAAMPVAAAAAVGAGHKRTRDEVVSLRKSEDGSGDVANRPPPPRGAAGDRYHAPHSSSPSPRPPPAASPASTDHTHMRGEHGVTAHGHGRNGRGGHAHGRGQGGHMGMHGTGDESGSPPGGSEEQEEAHDGEMCSEEGSPEPHDHLEGDHAAGDTAVSTHWWAPQPHPSSDPDAVVPRPAWALARALACCLCGDVLKEAITSVECGHAFCYDCIASRLEIGGNHNVCPLSGCGVVLGPDPIEHGKLRYDGVLDGIVSRVFPRPALDQALAARRAEREEGTREHKAKLAALPRRAAACLD